MQSEKNNLSNVAQVSIITILLKRIIFIVIFTIVCAGAGAGVGVWKNKVTYKATKEVLFTTNFGDYTKSTYSVNNNLVLAKMYVPTILSSIIQPKYINVANEKYGQKEINPSMVSVTYEGDSLIFSVSYVDYTKEVADKKLNAILETLSENIYSIVLPDDESSTPSVNAEITVLQRDAVFTSQNHFALYVLLGLVAGAVISCLIVIAAHFLNHSVKSKEELEELTGASVLANLTDFDCLNNRKQNKA